MSVLDDYTSNVSFLGGCLVVVAFFISRHFILNNNPGFNAIPTIGFSMPILSYFSAVRFTFDGVRMLDEGYMKTYPGLFKIPSFRRWMVLATGNDLIDDVKKAPDDVLSHAGSINELVQPAYTLDLSNVIDKHCTNVVRTKLMRDTAGLFDDVHDEFTTALKDLVPTRGHEWVKVPVKETMQRVICRTTNRVFVGLPLCRNYDYQTLNLTCVINVVKFGFIISLIPKPFKGIVSRRLSNLSAQIQQEIDFIRPMVEERLAMLEEYGEDWADKPNDLLMWLISDTREVKMNVEGLARRLLLANLAGLHSTSSTIMQVLYRLLDHPEHIGPLREEVDAVVSEEGWTKAATDKMYKIDSFVRETQRLDGIASLAVSRLSLRPFTFSNGVTIPAGTFISVPATAAQRDERSYQNPEKFDGFRFAKLREGEEDSTTSRYQAVSVSNEHLPFGVGRHTCPGRAFAIWEIKALFAHIVATYDLKFEEGKSAPPTIFMGELRAPGDTNILFRERKK